MAISSESSGKSPFQPGPSVKVRAGSKAVVEYLPGGRVPPTIGSHPSALGVGEFDARELGVAVGTNAWEA